MIIITNAEKEYLLTKGCVMGHDIHRTHTRYIRYFLTTTNKNKKLLNDYREAQICTR